MKIEIEPEIFNQLSKEEKLEYYRNEVMPKIKWGFDDDGYCYPSNLEYYNDVHMQFMQTYTFGAALRSFHRIKPEPVYVQYSFSDAKELIGKVVVHKDSKDFLGMILSCTQLNVWLEGEYYSYEQALKFLEYPDGTPFGKKVV